MERVDWEHGGREDSSVTMKYLRKTLESMNSWFNITIMLCIAANILVLASYSRDTSEELRAKLDIANAVFTYIFILEMVRGGVPQTLTHVRAHTGSKSCF